MQKKTTEASQQSIARALKLLNHFGETMTPLNVTEISKFLGISRSTAYAMLKEMQDMNYLSKDPKTGKYYLGYQNFILGRKTRAKYAELLQCDPYLTSFCQQKLPVQANSVCLWVMEQDYRMLDLLHKDPNSSTPNVSYAFFSPLDRQRVLPSYCTAHGKVMLSELSAKEQREALMAQDIKSYTESTVTDIDSIIQELSQVKKQGYCVDVEGYANFEVNVAAPIRDRTGKAVGAISISAAKLIFQGRPQDYIQLIVALGRELSALLGHRAPLY